MPNTTISPNMNLIIPTVSQDPGPDWATNINADLNAIDSHNHTAGQGVQITPSGININSDLPINNNNITTARSVRFQSQSSLLSAAADLGCMYESGVDLYYNDGAGNQVRITQSGSVTGSSGTITGLPSGTASASFSGGVFSFQSATGIPAELNIGSIIIGQQKTSGYGVTISANVSQAANYALTLPTGEPSSNPSTLTSDTSGNLSWTRLNQGTYTPTVTNVINTATLVVTSGRYFVAGNVCYVSGSLTMVATPNQLARFTISPPIATSSTNIASFNGAATWSRNTVGIFSADDLGTWFVQGDGSGNALLSAWPNPSNPSITTSFIFAYDIV